MDDITFGRSGLYGNAWLVALRYQGGLMSMNAFLALKAEHQSARMSEIKE